MEPDALSRALATPTVPAHKISIWGMRYGSGTQRMRGRTGTIRARCPARCRNKKGIRRHPPFQKIAFNISQRRIERFRHLRTLVRILRPHVVQVFLKHLRPAEELRVTTEGN